ncbi:MAG TPA: type II toxin-antitoxin system VapC family toxin [Candidatus Limnocylindrales bacterium]|nr:type II toxin-antitoxin system VapC family toxin [Candidatus Limnocylindrales bacterium]
MPDADVIVIDASAALAACLAGASLPDQGRRFLAPALLWSEVTSVLHEAVWRGDLERALAAEALDRLRQLPIERFDDPSLPIGAWRVADSLGWAKTYDAEYVATAKLASCPLLTQDARLARGAGRLIQTITAVDLA